MTKQNIVTLKETKYDRTPRLYSVVERCVICKARHIHGPEEGRVVAHCFELKDAYDLVIDRDDPENIRLAEKYGLDLSN